MAELKLARLPDRTPVKMTVSMPPDLHRKLSLYADAYREIYGKPEPLAELIPAMLTSFLESDRAFVRRCRSAPAR